MAHFPCHGRLKYASELVVHKVAMKLGKPLALGRLEDAVFIGLPGNPLAALAGAIGYLVEIAVMKDEFGRRIVHTEKVLYLTFRDGKLIEANNQFAIGDAKAYAARMAGAKTSN